MLAGHRPPRPWRTVVAVHGAARRRSPRPGGARLRLARPPGHAAASSTGALIYSACVVLGLLVAAWGRSTGRAPAAP